MKTENNDIILADFIENLRRSRHDGTDFIPLPATAAALSAKYPYFVLPAALRLKGEGMADNETRLDALKTAIATSDRTLLFRLTDPLAKEFENFYPPEEQQPEMSTEQAIDTFLSAYGTPDPKEDAILEKLIFNPVPEYSQVLIREADEKKEEKPTTIAKPLTANQAETETTIKTGKEKTPIPGASLTESLAKIYIKQQRYEKAYEIISNLNLNFPEKSRYFADQLRFLRKLILINRLNNQK